ncbi:MAG: DUF1611 domain-containing protein, partial [Methanobacteriales archaeon]|nr:DUF1611 domain-containing protein [Methanobacteriales archaeon]
KEEIRAIEAVEPTKVVGISLNLRNINDYIKEKLIRKYETQYNLPVADVKGGGSSKLLDAIIDHIGEV